MGSEYSATNFSALPESASTLFCYQMDQSQASDDADYAAVPAILLVLC